MSFNKNTYLNTMKHIILTALSVALAASACTARPTDGNFTAISAADNVKVIYTPGPQADIDIKTPEAALRFVKTVVRDNTLEISTERGIGQAEVTVTVTAPDVTAFRVKDNASLYIDGKFDGDNLAVSVSDNATFKAGIVKTGDMALRASDNAELKIRTRAQGGNVAVSGKDRAEIELAELNASNIAVNMSDGAELDLPKVQLHNVAMNVSDGAEIKICGTADAITMKASDNAEIDASALKAATGSAQASDGAEIKCSVRSLAARSVSDGAKIINR